MGNCDSFELDQNTVLNYGVKQELSQELKLKVMGYRNNFYTLFFNRYIELLPHVIKYHYTDEQLNTVNFLNLEYALRNGYHVVIGKNKLGYLNILGYINNDQSYSNPINFLNVRRLTHKDITFTIPKHLIPDEMIEISHHDNFSSGNFVIIRNKIMNKMSDFLIVKHYTSIISEIVSSRASLIIQSKLSTFFKGEPNDETLNTLINEIYNGSPFIKTASWLEVGENIITLDNSHISDRLAQLKLEYQNALNELNSMLGLDVLGVDKASGVSDIEAVSGNPFSKSIANIYIDSRQEPLKALGLRYGFSVDVGYQNTVVAELNNLNLDKEVNKTSENNNNYFRNNNR